MAQVKVGATGADAEASLVEAAVRGDVSAFACLYDRHVERVYRHIYYRVGNRSDAEDLTQQVFLQAWRAIERFERTGAPFVSWLLTIAYHAVVSFVRRAKNVPPLELDPIARERWADPEAETLAHYDRAAVRQAILRLRPDQQQVIIMRFVEHMDNEDVATALGKTIGNVRVIQHR